MLGDLVSACAETVELKPVTGRYVVVVVFGEAVKRAKIVGNRIAAARGMSTKPDSWKYAWQNVITAE
jgi:hypothetical protein